MYVRKLLFDEIVIYGILLLKGNKCTLGTDGTVKELLFSIFKIFIELCLCRENCMKINCGQNARAIIIGLSSDGENLVNN